MKEIQHYCSAVDKIKHDPACKQEVLNMANEKNAIHMTKRNGRIAGTAVAAALLAANIGGGYMLLHGRNQPAENPAGTSLAADTEISSAAELSAEEEASLPCYVQRMQQYYTGQSGELCDFDFTGLGADFDESWENDDYRLTLRAVTGCDWILYYFYDVEPKQGQTPEQYEQENAPCMQLEIPGTRTESSQVVSIPMQTGGSVWQYCGIVPNTTGIPFFHEKNAPDSKALVISVTEEDAATEIARKPLDFIRAEYPLEASALRDPEAANIPESPNDLPDSPPKHLYAQTPFGEFAVHGPYSDCIDVCKFTRGLDAARASALAASAAKEPDYQEIFKAFCGVYSLVNAEGKVIGEFTNSADSYNSYNCQDGSGFDCTYFLFTEPADLHAGSLQKTYIDPGTAKAKTDNDADIQTEETTEAADYETAPDDVPRVVYAAAEDGTPIEKIEEVYPETTDEENTQFEQISRYSKHIKLTLDGKELTGNQETVSPDGKNKLNFVFEWTPDTTLPNPDISIEIRPALLNSDAHDILIFDKTESQNTVAVEPVAYEDYQDPNTGEWLPASIPDAVAAFTPEPTSEKCLPLRFSLPIDLSKVNDPNGKQLTFWIDYRSADNAGNKKDVVFRQEYIFIIK